MSVATLFGRRRLADDDRLSELVQFGVGVVEDLVEGLPLEVCTWCLVVVMRPKCGLTANAREGHDCFVSYGFCPPTSEIRP